MQIITYSVLDKKRWDDVCENSLNGTFLHTRKFLSYHGTRFQDASLILLDEKGDVVGLFPAAIDPANNRRVTSHPGITYGGLLYRGRKGVAQVAEMLRAIAKWYREQGFTELIYKTTPTHFHNELSCVDQYVLWRLKAVLCRRDLWNVIALTGKRSLSKGRKWSVNKAVKSEGVVKLETREEAYLLFHSMLAQNLKERYGTDAVHSYDEMIQLSQMFPDQISLWLAYDREGNVCAGTWLFDYDKRGLHTQYIASTKHGRDIFAVDMLLEYLLRKAEFEGRRYFSFGASTDNNGLVANEGLFDFKAGFGIGAIVHDYYQLNLTEIEE